MPQLRHPLLRRATNVTETDHTRSTTEIIIIVDLLVLNICTITIMIIIARMMVSRRRSRNARYEPLFPVQHQYPHTHQHLPAAGGGGGGRNAPLENEKRYEDQEQKLNRREQSSSMPTTHHRTPLQLQVPPPLHLHAFSPSPPPHRPARPPPYPIIDATSSLNPHSQTATPSSISPSSSSAHVPFHIHRRLRPSPDSFGDPYPSSVSADAGPSSRRSTLLSFRSGKSARTYTSTQTTKGTGVSARTSSSHGVRPRSSLTQARWRRSTLLNFRASGRSTYLQSGAFALHGPALSDASSGVLGREDSSLLHGIYDLYMVRTRPVLTSGPDYWTFLSLTNMTDFEVAASLPVARATRVPREIHSPPPNYDLPF
ncbi:hypothetical protein B0H34DRAFT_676048 [Crassisporium funariophilum]|nr:hypothetical protein B0H34DRAFT_676048 [Crassisporium funariophilum]